MGRNSRGLSQGGKKFCISMGWGKGQPHHCYHENGKAVPRQWEGKGRKALRKRERGGETSSVKRTLFAKRVSGVRKLYRESRMQ